MTITSAGYAGTVSDQQWADMMPRVGSALYSVDDPASFKVSIAGGTRTVSVAAGGASAVGIYDVSNAPVTKSLSSVPSGTRWDLVVLRRTWATKVTSVEVIEGGSSMALPARTTNPGTVHEQPLALVRVDTSTSVQEVIDLRCVSGDGGLVAFHDMARSYLDRVGTVVRIGDLVWSRVVDALGSPAWVSSGMADTGWVELGKNNGWSFAYGQIRRVGLVVFFRIAAGRGSWLAGDEIAYIPAGFKPDLNTYVASSANPGNAEFQIKTTGIIAASQGSSGATWASLHGSYPAAAI